MCIDKTGLQLLHFKVAYWKMKYYKIKTKSVLNFIGVFKFRFTGKFELIRPTHNLSLPLCIV